MLGQLKLIADREFWSFRVIHALLGGLLTLTGAAGALYINDGLKNRISDLDNRIAALDARVDSIRTSLLQFRVVQSNGIILGALSTGEGIRDEFRESFISLMFNLRHGPALGLVGELYPADLANFTKERTELERLIAAAVAPDRTKESWDAVLNFEMSRERQVMDLQDRLQESKFSLGADRRRLEAAIETATFGGFVIQQIGFVVILLAGLVHQHAEGSASRRRVPEPS